MDKKELTEQELENVIGGSVNGNNVYLLCMNCHKTFNANYSGDTCDSCGSTELVWAAVSD